MDGHEDPYRKAMLLGLGSLGPVELTALALATDADEARQLMTSAGEVLRRMQGLRSYADIGAAELKEVAARDEFHSYRFLAGLHLGRRLERAGRGELPSANNPEEVALLLREVVDAKQEEFWTLFVNAKNEVIGKRLVHVGTLTMAPVGPREVFREAVRHGAAAVIVAHNHPSGDPTPSPEDILVTETLRQAGDVLDIPLLDHLIIGHGHFTSMKRKGYL
jgi:DNA repair protein RadC